MHPENVAIVDLHRQLGATMIDGNQTRFCVWAPNHEHVEVELVGQGRRVEMNRSPGGYHVAVIEGVTAGEPYFYRPRGNPPRPDPVSRFQPEGVHGPSQVIDRDFAWTDQDWLAPAAEDLIVYESHIGALTSAGTFVSAIDRLDELSELGVNAIELMPIAQCPGQWNWGYDGVNLFAPNHCYGWPADMRRFVDAAHAKGLAVILDVVYNHLGPEGNYLGEFGPYLSSRHSTPWGSAPNFDDPNHAREVRQFVIANAIYWLDEFHLDGLRVDAIHCMRDDSDPHIAAEISDAVGAWSTATGRDALLIAESNVYDPQMVQSRGVGGIGFDAQWCDDLLHSVSAVVRPHDQHCHRAYHAGTDLDQTLRMGFVYEGTLREQRGRRPMGRRVDTSRLVYSIQQHDFVGNHPMGERFHQLTSVDAQRAAATLLLLSPGIPMLFMGEEFACAHPFRFFVDFGDPQLRQAVAEGRRREYPQHEWDNGLLPTDPRTFQESKIGPREDGDIPLWKWYQSLIQLRQRLKANGVLHDKQLTVETDLRLGIYILRYAGTTESITAVVRLSAEGSADSITGLQATSIYQDGTLILDSRHNGTSPDALLPNHAKVYARKS